MRTIEERWDEVAEYLDNELMAHLGDEQEYPLSIALLCVQSTRASHPKIIDVWDEVDT